MHLTHPRIEDIELATLLHALSDPARLNIVMRLDDDRTAKGSGLACSEAACADLPRATMSHHYSVLRQAGLIESRKEGVRVCNALRRDELDRRFPGLLESVLAAKRSS